LSAQQRRHNKQCRSRIEEVNNTIIQMDESTQQNAALVEQAAVSRSMQEQGGQAAS